MDILYTCCAGLDVHKGTVVACVRRLQPRQRSPALQTRTFDTHTAALLRLAEWLSAEGVTHVAMESTGVYWRPIWNLLEGRFTLMLVNAQHIKQVPGRKTDVKDSAWIAQLLQHGLLRASFVPPTAQRQLRELTRQRRQLIHTRCDVANRIQKVLEDANIKLSGVATDVLGQSGWDMIEALIAGEQDATALAELARGRLRVKIPALREALQGRVTEHHRFLLRSLLDQVTQLNAQIERLTARIEDVLPADYRDAQDPALNDPGVRLARRRVRAGGGRRGHGRVPDGRAPGLVGRNVPRPAPERRQARHRADPARQLLVADGSGASGVGGEPHEEHGSGGSVPPAGRAAG